MGECQEAFTRSTSDAGDGALADLLFEDRDHRSLPLHREVYEFPPLGSGVVELVHEVRVGEREFVNQVLEFHRLAIIYETSYGVMSGHGPSCQQSLQPLDGSECFATTLSAQTGESGPKQ